MSCPQRKYGEMEKCLNTSQDKAIGTFECKQLWCRVRQRWKYGTPGVRARGDSSQRRVPFEVDGTLVATP